MYEGEDRYWVLLLVCLDVAPPLDTQAKQKRSVTPADKAAKKRRLSKEALKKKKAEEHQKEVSRAAAIKAMETFCQDTLVVQRNRRAQPSSKGIPKEDAISFHLAVHDFYTNWDKKRIAQPVETMAKYLGYSHNLVYHAKHIAQAIRQDNHKKLELDAITNIVCRNTTGDKIGSQTLKDKIKEFLLQSPDSEDEEDDAEGDEESEVS